MQEDVWEREYRNPKLVTLEAEPQAAVLKFLKYMRKERGVDIGAVEPNVRVLDLGCGTGRNSNYLAEKGASVVGMEISKTAVELASARARELGLTNVEYLKRSIGEKYPFENGNFDIVLDITSSNSLSDAERVVYASEVARVMKSGGVLFVRTLCKDGDANAKALTKNNPGPERDTYIMPDLGLVERVFSREDLVNLYCDAHGPANGAFKVLELEKVSHYTRVGDRLYKRNFWLGYFEKK